MTLSKNEIDLIQDALVYFKYGMQDADFSESERYYGFKTYYQFQNKVNKLIERLEIK